MMKPLLVALLGAPFILPATPRPQGDTLSEAERSQRIEDLQSERFEHSRHAIKARYELEMRQLRETRDRAIKQLNVTGASSVGQQKKLEYEAKELELENRVERELMALEQEFRIAKIDREIARLESAPIRTAEDRAVVESPQEIVSEAPSRSPIDDDFNGARARSAAEGKPLLAFFTGHTCLVGRQLEVTVMDNPEVAEKLGAFVEARLHSDAQDQGARSNYERRAEDVAKTMAQPTLVILDPRSGHELARAQGPMERGDFVRFLDGGLKAFTAPKEPATEVALWRAIFELEDEVTSLKNELAAERSGN